MISDIAMIMKCCIETKTSTSQHGEISIECTHDMPMTYDIWHDMAWYVKFAITWFGIVKRVKECITRQGRKKNSIVSLDIITRTKTFCCETSCLGKRLGPRFRRMILSDLNNSGGENLTFLQRWETRNRKHNDRDSLMHHDWVLGSSTSPRLWPDFQRTSKQQWNGPQKGNDWSYALITSKIVILIPVFKIGLAPFRGGDFHWIHFLAKSRNRLFAEPSGLSRHVWWQLSGVEGSHPSCLELRSLGT